MLDEKCTMTRSKSACSRIQDFCSFGKESPNYLDHVSEQVDKYRGQTVPLEKPAGYPMRIGGLDDTIYAEMEDELEAWEDFYLPERVEMRVIGAIDMFPSLAVGLQLIILAGKDGNIYAYENEVLHQVADSLQDLFQKGIEFPGTKVYNYGECFAPMTEEEYDELMQDEEVKKMKEETRESIKSNEAEFLSILARIEEKENAEKVASNEIVPSDHHRPKNVVVQLWKHADELFIFHLSDAYYEMWCKIFPLLRPTCEELNKLSKGLLNSKENLNLNSQHSLWVLWSKRNITFYRKTSTHFKLKKKIIYLFKTFFFFF
ncbi:hypothetical protein AOXY_G33762 [Acipenser oxyrinchus oxyrinchus]|uniref:Uncharacterized protein n=1 Tax=Acipenser oxyrinchus oxyrinchus TaxID=40147 RepID=A0AAD8CFN1_ACIOX|nr:hypothetical protein AOXY_G33762 [Acipenser oxyrinchus oxyrinchus]